MGIRLPGFQLLSLDPTHSIHGGPSNADALCLLPDQLGIYLSTYIPLLVLSLLVICVANIVRICSPRQDKRHSGPTFENSPSYAPLSGLLRSRTESGRPNDDWLRYPFEDDPDTLPRPTSSLSKKQSRPMYSQTFELLGRRRRITISTESITSFIRTIFSCCWSGDVPKSRGFTAGFLYDIRDVAIFPVAIFGVLSWWMFR
jgi:hypothetical protein